MALRTALWASSVCAAGCGHFNAHHSDDTRARRDLHGLEPWLSPDPVANVNCLIKVSNLYLPRIDEVDPFRHLPGPARNARKMGKGL